jgi:hypothetical protein
MTAPETHRSPVAIHLPTLSCASTQRRSALELRYGPHEARPKMHEWARILSLETESALPEFARPTLQHPQAICRPLKSHR